MRLSSPICHLKRRARLLARSEHIPLHAALDQIAVEEGFASWSALSARAAATAPDLTLLERLAPGDRLLLAARPGQGKALMGLRLLLDAVREGRRGVLFTLEQTQAQVIALIESLDPQGRYARPEIVTTGDISAELIVDHLSGAPSGTVAVIDYLQILDQQRSKPAIGQQLLTLDDFARASGTILAFISQIDRSFDPDRSSLPGLADIRRPNPFPPHIFSKACFTHAGRSRFERLA